MKFETRPFCRSVTVELKNDDRYRTGQDVTVLLDGKPVETGGKNVFSIYGLEPDRIYTLSVDGDEETFSTKHESVLLDVRRFGAKGDGRTDDTASIQAAIIAAPPAATVWIPAGTYCTGPIFLKSEMTLLFDEGAVLLEPTDRQKYPILPGMTAYTDESDELNLATWEGNPLDMFASPITAIGCHDLDIAGPGVVDARAGEAGWWIDPKKKREAWRPNLLFLNRCKDVRVQGLTIRNSPSWNVHPYYCDNVELLDLFIENPADSPNTDGIDPECCSNVLILGTRISVGDDCIAIKSGKLYMATAHFRRTNGIEIRNCLLEFGHGAVTVGSEIAAGVEDVHVTQCIFNGTDRGVRIKSRRGRGKASVLDRLSFENITMQDVHMPLTVNMFYFCDPDGHSDYVQTRDALPVDDRTPSIGSIEVKDSTCTGVCGCVVTAAGLPESPIGSITFENVKASFAPADERKPEQTIMAEQVPPMNGRSFVLSNVDTMTIRNVTVEGADDSAPSLSGVKTRNITGLVYH